MIETAGRDVTVAIQSSDGQGRNLALQITLVQSLPSGDKMDWVVQKAAELGVSAIQRVMARRSVVRLEGDRARKRVLHWQEVAISACEQCGRNTVPAILPLMELNQYLAREHKDDERRFLLDPVGGQRLRKMDRLTGRIALLIGPEGGFEEGEIDLARSLGFNSLQLGHAYCAPKPSGPLILKA